MVELFVVAEGHSEQALVHRLLAPYLGEHNVFATCHRITTSEDVRHIGGRTLHTVHRGGGRKARHLLGDIERLQKQHGRRGAWITTFIDLFRLPHSSVQQSLISSPSA